MLADKKLIAFIPTAKPKESKLFYKNTVGLELLAEDDFAIEFNAGGTIVRVIIVKEFKPQTFTVVGWNVDNIVSTIRHFNDRNIFFEQFDFLEQDKLGIWTSPSGAKVAWFKDPDGNILSLTDLESTKTKMESGR